MSDDGVLVRGLSWAHTRGHAPMVATGSAWSDRHPGVTIEWMPRSLADFAGGGLATYRGSFDLVALDHPLIGEAVEHGWLEPLEDVLSDGAISRLRGGTVGASFDSYRYDGRTWAAPLDAAALTSAYRSDLLSESALPRALDGVISLARETGRVAVPLTVFSCVALYLSISAGLGGEPFADDGDLVVDETVAKDALDRFRELAQAVPSWCLESGAVQLLSRLASGDDLDYVGYAYGYSVYARVGYFPRPVTFTAPPPMLAGTLGRPTLGGVGLALLAEAPQRAEAIAYLEWVTDADAQRGLFTTSGGQPAHADAWADPLLDELNGGFFSATLPSLQNAYVRPNAPWYGRFQPVAGAILHDVARGDATSLDAYAALRRALSEARTEDARA